MEDFFKFAQIGFQIGGAIIKGIWDFFAWIIGLFFEREAEAPAPNDRYTASFTASTNVLNKRNQGFCLGTRSLSVKDSFSNLLISAQTGMGKSSAIILPSIFRMAEGPNSLLIHDPSGELFSKSASYLESKGYTVKVLNFANPSVSEGFNPLTRANSRSEIQKAISVLVRSVLGDGGKDPYWNTQSVSLITLFCQVVKKQEVQYQNLANVKFLIDSFMVSPESVDMLVASCNDATILREYKLFVGLQDKLLSTIVSNCRAALSLFDDPEIQLVTAFDSLAFSELRSQKQAVYILNRTADMKYYGPLVSILAEQLLGSIMSRFPDASRENNIFLLLDELSAMYLPSLQIALSNVRKFSCGIMCVVQDTNQLKNIYGTHEFEAIRTNCATSVYFGNQPLDVCREISELLGKREFELEHEDGQKERRTRSLMTPDEVHFLEPGYALVFSKNHRASYCLMKPYFEQSDMLRFSQMPPLVITSKVPFTEVPFIPLKVHA